jgi:ABC-type nitrate/sulfonate/bicarbonate transport system substrate-binding protein
MKKKTLPLLGLAAAAALALSACGGSSAPEAETGGSTDSAQPTKISIQVAPIQYEPALIAQQEGYFEEAGLDVDITFGAGPAEMLAAVVAGEVEIAATSWSALAQAVNEGMPVEGIAGNGIVSPDFDSSGVLVAADSPIQTVADLEGKTIGVVGIGTGTEVPLFMQALEEGVEDPEGTITQVAIPYAGMQAALESGTVDAVFPADSFYFQIKESGARQIASPVREFQGKAPVTIWTSKVDWVEANADTVERFQEAMSKAIDFYMDEANEDAVLQVRADHLEVSIDELPSRTLVPMSLAINFPELQTQLDAMKTFGHLPEMQSADLFWQGAPRNE